LASAALVVGLLGASMTVAKAQSLGNPTRLALTAGGNMVVSDYGRRVLTLDGTTLEITDILAIDDRPAGVAWGGGLLYVGNDTTGDVEIYRLNSKGSWQQKGRLGSGPKGQIPNPMDIAVDQSTGRILVVSGGRGDNSVMVFDAGGRLLYSFPAPCSGSCSTGVASPGAIALDTSNDLVMITDGGDISGSFGPRVRARVQIYNQSGGYVGTLQGRDQSGSTTLFPADFRFSRPQGLDVDPFGRVYLTDAVRSEVLVFEYDGVRWNGVAILGSLGTGPGQLMFPMDVAVDRESLDVLVLSNRTARVEVFEQGGVLP
jgi:DNA-binding beta-propeller fold protein YncE